jgi:hypothetical protein
MSSVAMMTREMVLAFRQRSQTCWIRGLPKMGNRGFPGNLVEAQRAGIMATAFILILGG